VLYRQQMFNPNPHCFIAITKATACGLKEPLLPHPLHSPVRGRGKRGASYTALKICLIKTWVTLKLSSKAYWKWHFKWKPLKLKSLLTSLARHFWLFKNILLKPSRTYFHSKDFLNSQAVRISGKQIFLLQVTLDLCKQLSWICGAALSF
jgi:hypothetical protein